MVKAQASGMMRHGETHLCFLCPTKPLFFNHHTTGLSTFFFARKFSYFIFLLHTKSSSFFFCIAFQILILHFPHKLNLHSSLSLLSKSSSSFSFLIKSSSVIFLTHQILICQFPYSCNPHQPFSLLTKALSVIFLTHPIFIFIFLTH